MIPETRRLVEEDGAQAIVGPLDPEEGMVLREYARKQPGTAFLIEPSGAPELTLTDPAPNVFRFASDAAQFVAGAGTYAYRELGWRTAAIVADDVPYSWDGVAGFVAEFCALGGRIVDRTWITPGTDPAAVVPRIPRADGVYLGPAVSPMLGFVKRYAALHHDLSRRLVSNTGLLYDPTVVAQARGVVVAGSLPVEQTAAEAAYAASFTKAFPAVPAAVAIGSTTVPYRDGVEALLEAFERSGGATGAPLLARSDPAPTRFSSGPDPSRREPPGRRPELPQPDRNRREGQADDPYGACRPERRADVRRVLQAGRSAAEQDDAGLREADAAAVGAMSTSTPGSAASLPATGWKR